ncbi:MAG: hypothetical protein FWE03_01460 [Firmicutes bacterium]|nr:hypothetical protein [Bacillota bacterium]
MVIDDYIKVPIRKKRRIRINNFFSGMDYSADEGVLSKHIASENYNFDFSSGALTDGYGIVDASINSDDQIKNIFRFKKGDEDILLMQTSVGCIKYLKDGMINKLEGINLKGNIKGINYRLLDEDVILLCSDSENMVVWNGINSAYSVPSSPKIGSLALHFERLFVADTDGETVRFSSDLDPTNWTSSLNEGGYIKLVDDRGRIGKLISFLNHIYIFREYGISRLTAFGDQRDFSVTNLFVSSGRIYADTVALIGDRVIFLASDGLYSFDGLSARRILRNLDGLIVPDKNAKAHGALGSYYLSCCLNGNKGIGCENGKHINNGLLSIKHGKNKYLVTRGVDIKEFSTYKGDLLAVSNGIIGKIEKVNRNFDQIIEKLWLSPKTDLGTDSEKVLEEIHIESNVNADMSIESETDKKSFKIKAKNGINRIRVHLRGRLIGFKISVKCENARINRPVLVVSEL